MAFRTLTCSLVLFASALVAALPAQDQRVAIQARFVPAEAPPGADVVLEVELTIEPGWHVYGARDPSPVELRVTDRGGLTAQGKAIVPPGRAHDSFGVTNYWVEGSTKLRQRFQVPADAELGARTVTGKVAYMACTPDYCEPPTDGGFTAELRVAAGAAAVRAVTEIPVATVPGLQGIPGGIPGLGAEGKLTLKASFEPNPARPGEDVRLIVEVTVEDGWHVYGSQNATTPTLLLLKETGGLEARGEAVVPPGVEHKIFDLVQHELAGTFRIAQVLRVPADATPGEIALRGEVDHLPCDENQCLDQAQAPFTATLQIEEGEVRALAPAPGGGAEAGPADGTAPQGGKKGFASLWLLILASIGGGLFALAMPCTYPMIPITFSFFTKQAEQRGGSVLPLALTYGIGIVLMFVLIGVAVGPVIIAFANHWIVNSILALAFLVFAFALFGWLNLEPPNWLRQMSGKASAAGGLLGVFLMGATLVIASFTCTAPIVGTLLAQVGTSGEGLGEVALGMSVFGLTMAAPFVFLSLLPGKVKQLPRAGEWMNTLKVSLGFIEIAAALKFFSNVDLYFAWAVFPRELFLVSWAAIFLLAALYLFGLVRGKGTTFDGVGKGRLTSGMVSFVLAFYFLYGAMGFRMDFITTSLAPPYSAQLVVGKGGAAEDTHGIVKDDFTAALRTARAEGKLLVANFTGFN